MYIKRNSNYLSLLTSAPKRIFRITELALIWNIENPNTLRVMVNRYHKRKVLFRIIKGIYSKLPINQLDIFEIGCAVAGPLSYI